MGKIGILNKKTDIKLVRREKRTAAAGGKCRNVQSYCEKGVMPPKRAIRWFSKRKKSRLIQKEATIPVILMSMLSLWLGEFVINKLKTCNRFLMTDRSFWAKRTPNRNPISSCGHLQ
jgi:hypothetical protein